MLDLVTFIVYLVAGFVSILVALRSHLIFSGRIGLHRLLWSVLAVGMILFGTNELLDLQTPFTWVIKDLAWQQGWYDRGQSAQEVFIIGLIVASLIAIGAIFTMIRNDWRKYLLLLVGLLVIARFVTVRAASFYGVPLPELSRFIGGLKINWTLELFGALLVIVSAMMNLVGSRLTNSLKTF